MKKIIISIVTFVLIFILSYLYLDKAFVTSHYFINSFEDFKDLSKKTNVDVIFFGSSHSFTSYNPVIINNSCKTVSYNLGSDSLLLLLTDLLLQESLNNTHPKLVVLDVYPGIANSLVTKDVKGYQLRALDAVSKSTILKFQKVKQLYSTNEYLSVYSRIIRNHPKWYEIDYLDLSRKRRINKNFSYYMNGYIGSFKNIKSTKVIKKYGDFRNFPTIKKEKGGRLKPKSIEEIKSFIDIAKKNGIEVLIVSSPDSRAKTWNYKFFDDLNEFCKSQNVNFLNFNNYYKELDLTIDDFKDPGHLNFSGGTKTSNFLANYINENYRLPDRSSDAIWKFNNAEFNRFVKETDTTVKIFTKYLNQKFVDQIVVESLELRQSVRNLKFRLKLKKTKNLKEVLKKYSIMVKVFPEDSDIAKLNILNTDLGRDYDRVNMPLGNSDEIDINLYTRVKNIKRINMFLFNRHKYNGVIGEPIILKKVNFK